MTDAEIIDALAPVMAEEVDPALASHGGGGTIIKVEDGVVYIELEGGCKGCPGARMTMKMVLKLYLKKEFRLLKKLLTLQIILFNSLYVW